MKISVILIDIDDTLTATDGTPDGIESGIIGHLAGILCKLHGIGLEEARQRIFAVGDLDIHPVSDYLSELGLDRREYFDALVQAIKQHTVIPDDAADFLCTVRSLGIRLYSATTNPEFFTCAKLAVGGLAGVDGSPFFTGHYPGCCFGDRRGKFSPDYFPSILRHGGFDAKTTMMVGDSFERDIAPALAAGIGQVAHIDRKRSEALTKSGGVMFVNSLDILSSLLEATGEPQCSQSGKLTV